MAYDPKGDLLGCLRHGREAVVWKLDGLGEHEVGRPMTPTGTNLHRCRRVGRAPSFVGGGRVVEGGRLHRAVLGMGRASIPARHSAQDAGRSQRHPPQMDPTAPGRLPGFWTVLDVTPASVAIGRDRVRPQAPRPARERPR